MSATPRSLCSRDLPKVRKTKEKLLKSKRNHDSIKEMIQISRSEKMAAKDRLELIKNMIQTEKKVVVSELSSIFGVTEETIRRDLEKLENEGVLTRTFGGAVLNIENQREGIHFYQRAGIHIEEKRKMAIAFAPFLKDKLTIAADASTTVMEVVKLIPNSRDVTLLTTSTAVFNEMANTDIHILSVGGVFNRSTLSLQGTMAKENIKKYHVDLLLISCKGLDMEYGIMDSKEAEAEVKKTMSEHAREVALFADHSKFDKRAFAHLLDFGDIDYLVTDKKPDDRWVEFCERNHITLVY